MRKQYPISDVNRELKAHAREHGLKLLEMLGVTAANLEEAKQLICETSDLLTAKQYGRGVFDSAGCPVCGMYLLIGVRGDMKPCRCPDCSKTKFDWHEE